MKEIVIKIHDIPQNDHERWVLKNGTLLPKGHGRLIDADEIIEKIRMLPNGGMNWFVNAESVFGIILNAQTIIEADGGGEDDR